MIPAAILATIALVGIIILALVDHFHQRSVNKLFQDQIDLLNVESVEDHDHITARLVALERAAGVTPENAPRPSSISRTKGTRRVAT